MKINFDYQIFAMQYYGGISRYYVRLFENILSLGEEIKIVSPIYINKYLEEINFYKNIHGFNVRKIPAKLFPFFKAGNEYLGTKIALKLEPDLIHETYYSLNQTFNIHKARRVLTVYDMIHEKFADNFNKNDNTTKFKKAAVERVDHIICISHSTKKDLCETFNINPDKVSVVHLAFDSGLSIIKDKSNYDFSPFLLYVGNRSGYKNFGNFLKAVSINLKLKNNIKIIAFGGGKFTENENNLISSLGFRSNFVKQINGDDNLLNQLYNNAVAFVYPSLYEGFGLPPLEAMVNNCPVICSNTSSIPEVVGNAGQYFDPYNLDSQCNALEKVVYDTQLRAKLIIEGKERINCFSWNKCAQETVEVYKKILKNNY
jgi:glycosyltransferase involved in cell wall biosynthesis